MIYKSNLSKDKNMLSKFAQACIAIGVIGGLGYGASYMADSPIVDKALNALNEKSVQIQEAQKQKEILAQQEQHLNEQRKQEELQAKQEVEKAVQAKLQQDQLIAQQKQQIAEQEVQKIVQQKLAEAELAKQERLKNEQAQQKQAQQNVETAPLPEVVKLHVKEATQTATQTTDNAMNKLLGQTK